MPIHISNLSFYDKNLDKGIRIGFRYSDNKKIRFNKSTGKDL